jgi:hypothetical protein
VVTTVGLIEETEFLIGLENDDPFVGVTQDVYAAPDGPWQMVDEGGTTLRWRSNFYTYADFSQEEFETEVVLIPRTGQTQSYYPGDDGDLQKGAPWPVPRFTNNGDGTVTDNLTGLMWSEFAAESGGTWPVIMDLINEMEVGGYDDWRMPNRRELESLIDISRSNPAIPAGHPFQLGNIASLIWTSSTYAGYEGRGAWAVDPSTGESVVREKAGPYGFDWPVRDGN